MKSAIVKFSKSTKEVKEVEQVGKNKKSMKQRIDEERLFNLFTADIMKLKKKFIR
jgi:hypothetical protein